MHQSNTSYDFIIAGGGCAGLSLLYAILQQPQLKNKQILVLDKVAKNSNDRTWCFWEKNTGLFEQIVCKRWNKLQFSSNCYSNEFEIAPYEYKMIRGIDFYNFVIQFAQKHTNVHFAEEQITELGVENKLAFAKTATHLYQATYIFNSTNLLYQLQEPMLLQHFMGWEIETNTNCFNSELATFMDFTVAQSYGTTFMYVLPISATKALVEYTLFTENILEKQAYEAALNEYISQKLGIQQFTITHTEFGVIPMSKQSFEPHHQHQIINIGTAGGCVKASSGYTFSFIQKQTKAIVNQLAKGDSPVVDASAWQKRFHLYDKTLLNVLLNKKLNGDEVFSMIFKNNSPNDVLAFLDNGSDFIIELKIMSSVPTSIFLPAAFKEMFA